MKITNIGGATAILEHKNKRILFDPWLNDGIFNGAWFHYPPLKMGISDLGRFDYIYISHIHEDHCAAGTIKHLNKDAEVILIDREPHFVKKFLAMNNFHFKKMHLIKPYTPTPLEPGLTCDMIEADPAHHLQYIIDSALILKWDDFVLYNANDCEPYPKALQYILSTYKKVDLALVPYAGGSAFPACFTNLSHEEKLKEKQRIYETRLQVFADTIKTLKPRYAMPFADQYVIGGSRSALNQYLPHPPDGGVVLEALKKVGMESKALLLNSAQSFDFESGQKSPDEPFHFHSGEEKERYIETVIKDSRYDYEGFELDRRVSFERLIGYARAHLWKAQERDHYFPKFTYYLDIPDWEKRVEIDLSQPEPRPIPWQAPLREPYLRVAAPSNLMAMLLIGHISWNIADAALFLDYERVPNVYDPKLHAFVNHLTV
jgi:UDP-MurNAc hydroxylase